MNKKNLSVVMAGAMLATSVAPVLADTTTQKDYTVNNSNKGLLIKELRELINSKTFANVEGNKTFAGDSVYYVEAVTKKDDINVDAIGSNYDLLIPELVQVANKYNLALKDSQLTYDYLKTTDNNTVLAENELYSLTVHIDGRTAASTGFDSSSSAIIKIRQKNTGVKYDNTNIAALENAIQSAAKDTLFKVYEYGNIEKDGKYYHYYQEATTVYDMKYTEKELEDLADAWENNTKVSVDNTTGQVNAYGTGSPIQEVFEAVYDMSYENGVLTVKTRKAADEANHYPVEIKVGDVKVDFRKPVNDKDEVVVGNNDPSIVGFKKVGTEKVKGDVVVPETKLLYTVTISDVDYNYTTVLSKLYDGLFLTEDGQKLLDTMKKYDSEGWSVLGEKVSDINDDANGIYSLVITFEKEIANGKTEKQTVKITTNDRDKLEIFANGITAKEKTVHGKVQKARNFPVEVLAGSNRYETAVKVAKENADIKTVAENGNIVLVNGNSLVDGLAAAPLAASVQNLNNSAFGNEDYVAPILLTDANGIPKVTKDYMKEVVAHQRVGALDQVTVYLVGGEAVISKAVENDLKEIGVRVVRAGGADREATSLAVAELMAKDGKGVDTENAFLVGANGEADAMSIASVAAREKTPIIVESVHGIKEDTINYLKGYKNTGLEGKDVTIIGGEAVVSNATEKELTDAKLSVKRVAGSNRQATNAKVMQLYYNNGDVKRFVVSKDGINNKSELIDALTATSLAVKDNAPIVLGTNKITNDQINTMELKAQKTGVYVYQVGYGVARDIVQTIANRVGLAK